MEAVTHPRRVYAIISIRHLPGVFQVLKVQAVPYQSVSRSTAFYISNRLHTYIHLFADIQFRCTYAPEIANRYARDTSRYTVW